MGARDDSARHAVARGAPADSNQAFLRMMIDHHQGFLAIVDRAMPDFDTTAKDGIAALRQQQRREQEDMMQLLSTEFDDPVTPVVRPADHLMMDAVARSSTPDRPRVLQQQLAAHYREGLKLIDQQMEHLAGKAKQIAITMRTNQLRDLAQLEVTGR